MEHEHGPAADKWDWPLQHEDGFVQVINTPNRFEVDLEVQNFTSNEIKVTPITGHMIEVHLEHHEELRRHWLGREKHGGDATRCVQRTYRLPDDVDMDSLRSKLDARGILVITAAKKP